MEPAGGVNEWHRLLDLINAGEGLLNAPVAQGHITDDDSLQSKGKQSGTKSSKSSVKDSNKPAANKEDPLAAARRIVDWLNQERQNTIDFHAAPLQTFICAGLQLEPYDHQRKSLAMIEHNKKHRKAILFADPPGFGKTLPSMMAMVNAIPTARIFSLVVAPTSCVNRWAAEYKDTVKIYVLQCSTAPITMLCEFDVVITSYSFLMEQYRKRSNFINKVSAANAGKIRLTKPPTRPNLSMFSDVILKSDIRFPFLILDEASVVKSHGSLIHTAVTQMAQHSDMVIMLSGNPMDYTWTHWFGLLAFVKDQPVTDMRIMKSTFGSLDDQGKLQPPCEAKLKRFIKLLSTFVVRRPESNITLPPLFERKIIFNLPEVEARASNRAFAEFSNIIREAGEPITRDDRLFARSALSEAWHHSMHPMMAEIVPFQRLMPHQSEGDQDSSVDMLSKHTELELWQAWKQKIATADNWSSSRIDAIISEFDRQRDLDPSAAFLIFEDSVYFLDIIEIAFSKMDEPIDCLRFDGRMTGKQQIDVLRDFNEQHGTKVLLISRTASASRVKIQAASVIFLCSPWWSTWWEEQAIQRAWGPGQTKPITLCRFIVSNCLVEKYRRLKRDIKHFTSAQIMDALTKSDSEQPKLLQHALVPGEEDD